jgi:hypothetical protein
MSDPAVHRLFGAHPRSEREEPIVARYCTRTVVVVAEYTVKRVVAVSYAVVENV